MKMLDWFRYDFCVFFRNLWVFRKALWNYRRWDQSGLLEMMETSARDMAVCHHKGHLERSDKTAKELRIFAEYLKRIREEEYSIRYIKIGEAVDGKKFWQRFEPLKYEGPVWGTNQFHKIAHSCSRNDLKEAAKLFERKVLSWWD